jgi:AraC-like DNA-binding protein
MLYFILEATNKIIVVESLVSAMYFINFAYPACAYLYVRGFIKDENRLQKKDWFHFIPAVFAAFYSILEYVLGTSNSSYRIFPSDVNKTIYSKENYDIFSNVVSSSLQRGVFIIYLFFIWRMVLRAGIIKDRSDNFIATNWILLLVVVMTFTNLIFLISTLTTILYGSVQSTSFLTSYGYTFLCATLVVLIIFVFYNPKILYGYVFVSKEFAGIGKGKQLVTTGAEKIAATVVSKITKPINIIIPANLVANEQLYLERITTHIEIQKPFLKGDYSIAMLSHATAIPTHHCSYIINNVLGFTFRDWINSYRVNHFIVEYPSKMTSNTIVAIALDCGFNNKITFYNAFKKQKGVSPTVFFSTKVKLLP